MFWGIITRDNFAAASEFRTRREKETAMEAERQTKTKGRQIDSNTERQGKRQGTSMTEHQYLRTQPHERERYKRRREIEKEADRGRILLPLN